MNASNPDETSIRVVEIRDNNRPIYHGGLCRNQVGLHRNVIEILLLIPYTYYFFPCFFLSSVCSINRNILLVETISDHNHSKEK